MWKHYLHRAVTPITTVLLLIYSFYGEDLRKNLFWAAPSILFWFVVGLTLLEYIVNFHSPYKKLMKLRDRRLKEMDDAAKKMIATYKRNGIELSCNVMLARTYLIHPSGRFGVRFFRRVLYPTWNIGNHLHRRLSFVIDQGCCGEAFRDGDIAGHDLSNPLSLQQIQARFNLTTWQAKQVQNIKMVVSCAIKEEQTDAKGKRVFIPIGVLNVESKTPNSGSLISVEKKKNVLYKNVKNLANAYSHF